MKAIVAAAAVLVAATAAAHADSLRVELGLNGSYGGNGGYHVIVIDGMVCRLKNSTFGNIPGGQPQGCNYKLTHGKPLKVQTSNYGCSKRCE